MKRYFQVTFVLITLLFLGCIRKQKDSASETKTIPTTIVNELPDMQVRLMDGNTVDIKGIKSKVILVLFQPDCDHCQNEARQIEAHLDDFQQYDLYFISSASTSEVKTFAEDYNLSGRPKVWFGTTTLESILNNFGGIPAPSLYIYHEGGKLIQELNGEIDISVILKYL